MNSKRLRAIGLLVATVGFAAVVMAQGAPIVIETPKPNQAVRGEIVARFTRPFPDQGYVIVRLDGEFKEATSLQEYVINTRKLSDGEHTLTLDARGSNGKPAGVVSVTFRVANELAETEGEGVRLLHWDLSHFIPTKRLLRYRIWAESLGQAVSIAPPTAQGGMPGMPGGQEGMMGGGDMPGAMGSSRMGRFNSPYQGLDSGGGDFLGGAMGSAMGPGAMGAMGMGGPGGGGAGSEGAADASRLDKQMSLLVRSQVREINKTLLDGQIRDAASIRLVIASALERTRQGATGGGVGGGDSFMGGAMGPGGGPSFGSMDSRRLSTQRSQYQGKFGGGAPSGMPGMPGMGMPGAGMPGMPGMPGAGGAGGGAAGRLVKPPWSPFWFNSPLSNLTFTKSIVATGEEIRSTGRLGFNMPYGKPPTSPLVDLLPRFPDQDVRPGTNWTTPMVFIPELIEMSPVELNNTLMSFTAIEELTGRKCAKLEAEITLPSHVAEDLARLVGASVGSGGFGGGGGGGETGDAGGPMGSMMGGSRLAEPELRTQSSKQLGLGSFGAAGGMMGQLAGTSGGMPRMPGMGGMMGGSMGMGGMPGMGGSMGMGGMPGMGGSMGMGGMGGMGGMSGGTGGRGENLNVVNVKSSINRVIHFDYENKSVYRMEDIARMEFDILGQSGGGGGAGGDLMGMMGALGGMMGGMMGSQPPIQRRGENGGDSGAPAGPPPDQQQRTHVVYQVRIVAWQDTETPAPTWVHNQRGERKNAHDYDNVKEDIDRVLPSSDPKRPADRVFSAEDLGMKPMASKPAPATKAGKAGKSQKATSAAKPTKAPPMPSQTKVEGTGQPPAEGGQKPQ